MSDVMTIPHLKFFSGKARTWEFPRIPFPDLSLYNPLVLKNQTQTWTFVTMDLHIRLPSTFEPQDRIFQSNTVKDRSVGLFVERSEEKTVHLKRL